MGILACALHEYTRDYTAYKLYSLEYIPEVFLSVLPWPNTRRNASTYIAHFAIGERERNEGIRSSSSHGATMPIQQGLIPRGVTI